MSRRKSTPAAGRLYTILAVNRSDRSDIRGIAYGKSVVGEKQPAVRKFYNRKGEVIFAEGKPVTSFQTQPAVFFAKGACGVYIARLGGAEDEALPQQACWNRLRRIVSELRGGKKARNRMRVISRFPTEGDQGSCYYANSGHSDPYLGFASVKKVDVEFETNGKKPTKVVRTGRIDLSQYDVFPTRIGSASCPIELIDNPDKRLRAYLAGKSKHANTLFRFRVKAEFLMGRAP